MEGDCQESSCIISTFLFFSSSFPSL